MSAIEAVGEAQARAGLATIPFLAGHDPATARLTRLGGLTNLVYKVELAGEAFCLRIPGPGTAAYINRTSEAVNARAAALAGVAPALLHVDAAGLMLTRFVEGAVTMAPEDFRARPGAVARAGQTFARLHRSGQIFAFRFELFAMIDDYLGVLERLGAELPEGYHDVVREAGPVREALAAHPVPLAPCHCDPLCENFLDGGKRMWIVDWEYSGMNDPMWDLGDLSVEGGFDEAQDRELLEAYFAGPVLPFDQGRMVVYKAMCDLLWTLWGLIQHANGNPAEDFWAYAISRLARCTALMRNPAFTVHLAAVRAG